MKKFPLIITSLITLLLFSNCQKKNIERTDWRGLQRNGFYTDENLMDKWPDDGPQLLWSTDTHGMGYSSAVPLNDKVLITGTSKRDSISYIFAFSHSGELLWQKVLGPEWVKTFPGVRSTPTIVDTLGYVLNGLNVLTCFDTQDGEKVWEINFMKELNGRNIQHGITENLLIEGDNLYCTPGGEEVNIVKLNRFSGDLIWASKAKGEISAYCSPSLITHNKKQYLITMTYNSILSLDVSNGELMWSKELTEPKYGIHSNVPIYKNGHIFYIDGWGYGAGMLKISDDGKSIEEVWFNKKLDVQMGDAIILGDKIYTAGGKRSRWYCIDWFSGEQMYENKEMKEGTVISANGLLYIFTYNGEMALVKPGETNFEIISRFKVPIEKTDHFTQPVIGNGRLYIRYQNKMWVYSI